MPQPVAFYPLNARYKASEKDNRQPQGFLYGVAITNGPYNELGGAYMFYGTRDSYIRFHNSGGLDTLFSITLMCWVQPEHYSGLLLGYGYPYRRVLMWIADGKFYNQIFKGRNSQPFTSIRTAEVLPVGKWVHVAASYDHNTGNNSLYINGHFSVSQNIGKGYEIGTTSMVIMGVTNGFERMENFKGKIAEMKIYDVALNEAQIQTSIRQGSCSFPEIIVSLHSPMIPLIIETPVIGHPRYEVAGTRFGIPFRKTKSR